MKRTFIFVSLILILSVSAFAQAKKKTAKKPVTKTPAPAAALPVSIEPIETVSAPLPPKKNERPESESNTQDSTAAPIVPKKKNQTDRNSSPDKQEKIQYPYKYEFSQPNFVVKSIIIEHDENGKGMVTFENKDFGEPITDPLQLSPITLEKLKTIFGTLNFLDSTENYQSPTRDYGHLGNHTVTFRRDSRERVAKYNWTENKDAKALTDEYRKIGEQYVWNFDISVARENQPLEAPSLMDRLDSLIKRDEISDPAQMLPFLKELSNDERIPLIARNHATRMIKDIEKKSRKNEK